MGGRKIGAKIKISMIKGAEESVSGDNGVKKDVDGGERGDMGGGGTRREEAVTARGAPHTSVYVRLIGAVGAGKGDRGGRPFLPCNGIIIGRG